MPRVDYTPSWFDVTTRWQMVGTVLRLNPTMILPNVIGCKTVARSHRMTFFTNEVGWRELRSKDCKVTRLLTKVGKSSFQQYAVITWHGSPVCSLTTACIAVDDNLHHSIPLPRKDVMQAAMHGQEVRKERLHKMPWKPWAFPGGGSEHAEEATFPQRPEHPFRLSTIVRYVECDEFGHMSQSQYALLMEETRASAVAAGAYGDSATNFAAGAPPRRFHIDYLGQAMPGDEICIFSWWDGASVCCEICTCHSGENYKLMARSRVWTAHGFLPMDDDVVAHRSKL